MEPGSILLIALVFGGVLGLFVLIAVMTDRRGGAATDRLGGAAERARSQSVAKAVKASQKHAAKDHSESLAARLSRRLSRVWRLGDTSQSRLQETLVHAGIREKGAVELFLGAKLALAVALPAGVVGAMLWRSTATGHAFSPKVLFLGGAISLILGLIGPNIWLRRKAAKRVERIRLSLPDALDLMIVCVESGLGLEAALVRISREMYDVAPDFCEELALLNLEIGAGKPRDECLRNLALRSGCDEVESLCARINQANRYGTSLGHSLRIHSESLRQKRRQEAEERAAKTTIKLLFPLIFFIFPAIFVVILGPAVVKVAETLF